MLSKQLCNPRVAIVIGANERVVAISVHVRTTLEQERNTFKVTVSSRYAQRAVVRRVHVSAVLN